MNYPKISIVTPNFNGGEFLEETMLSVLSQNYPNLEYIIIDGGSTDNSLSIIKKYENQLAYWISEPDKGLYSAIQKGFDKSSGAIMAWINSDDLYHKNAFFTVAEIFSNLEEVNWLQGIPSVFDEKSRVVNVAPLRRWSKLDYYLGNFRWIQQESVFWRRNLWEKSGEKIATEMKYAGDLELWLRFFRYEKLYVTAALLGGFRQRSKGQLSLDFLNQYIEEANAKIKEEVDNRLPKIERKLVLNIKKYTVLIKVIPFKIIRRILNKILHASYNKSRKNNFKYPPVVSFDRSMQKFKI